MAWKVDRWNELRNDRATAVRSFANPRLAFDAAWDQMGDFIKRSIRNPSAGDRDEPSDEQQFKIIVETRAGRKVGFELRYDYFIGGPNNDWETNSIFWRIREE